MKESDCTTGTYCFNYVNLLWQPGNVQAFSRFRTIASLLFFLDSIVKQNVA